MHSHTHTDTVTYMHAHAHADAHVLTDTENHAHTLTLTDTGSHMATLTCAPVHTHMHADHTLPRLCPRSPPWSSPAVTLAPTVPLCSLWTSNPTTGSGPSCLWKLWNWT